MPESAISGLVEGILQGHAIRQQKQRDAEEKNRQHAQDVAAYHIQDWKEKQAAELNKQNAAQQGIDNQLAQDRLGIQKAEEARKVTSDANKDKYNQSRVEAAKNLPRERYIDDAYKNSATVDDFNKAMALYDLMHPTNQTPPATGGAPVTPALPGAQQAPIIPQVPRGFDTPGNPAFGQQGAPPPPSGILNPKVAAGIEKTQADTTKATAATQLLTTEDLEHIQNIELKKAQTANAQEMKKLTEAKTALTHQQEADRKAMSQPNLDLKHAQINLTEAKIADEHVKQEYAAAHTEHIKIMDNLRASGKDLADVSKRAGILKQANDAENKFRTERWKQEDNLAKMKANLHAYENLAAVPEANISKPADLAAIHTAQQSIPDIKQRIKDQEARIASVAAKETEAAKYATNIKKIIHPTGVVDNAATDAARKAADKKAADAMVVEARAQRAADKPPSGPLPGMSDWGHGGAIKPVPVKKVPAPGKKAGALKSKPLPASGGGKHYIYDPKTGQMKEQ